MSRGHVMIPICQTEFLFKKLRSNSDLKKKFNAVIQIQNDYFFFTSFLLDVFSIMHCYLSCALRAGTILESPPQIDSRIMAQVYLRSITRNTMYQKAPFC